MDVRFVLGLLLAGAALSGCFGDEEGASTPIDGSGAGDRGSLEGVVTDEDQLPVAEARVALRAGGLVSFGSWTNSSADGGFVLADLPVGDQVFVVTKDGYESAVVDARILAGQSTITNVTLVQIPKVTVRNATQAAIPGRYQCAAAWGTETGSCDGALPSEAPAAFDTSNRHNFTVPPGWGGLLLEVEWQTGSESALVSGLRLEVLGANGTGTYAALNATQSPLRLSLDQGRIHSGADLLAPLPGVGADVVLHVRPLSSTSGPTCTVQCTEGVAAGLDVTYTIWPTLFFGSGVDPEFTALDESA